MNGDDVGLRGHLALAALAPLVAAATVVAFPAADAWGAVGLDILVVGLFGLVLYLFRPEIYRSLRAMVFFAAGFAVLAVAAGLVARQSRPASASASCPGTWRRRSILICGRCTTHSTT